MAGTFSINSGIIGYPAYLSLDDVRSIARSRSEIGGASLHGNDLSSTPTAVAGQEVFDDRSTLAQLGFQVTNNSASAQIRISGNTVALVSATDGL